MLIGGQVASESSAWMFFFKKYMYPFFTEFDFQQIPAFNQPSSRPNP